MLILPSSGVAKYTLTTCKDSHFEEGIPKVQDLSSFLKGSLVFLIVKPAHFCKKEKWVCLARLQWRLTTASAM